MTWVRSELAAPLVTNIQFADLIQNTFPCQKFNTHHLRWQNRRDYGRRPPRCAEVYPDFAPALVCGVRCWGKQLCSAESTSGGVPLTSPIRESR